MATDSSEDHSRQMTRLLDQSFSATTPPEVVRMLKAILNGSQMGPGEGWFGPAATRFDWNWLAATCGVDPSEAGISQEQFAGSPEWFRVLDRNRDGKIQPEDLDWSEENTYVQTARVVNRIFRRLDASGRGELTRDEWNRFFDHATGGKETMTTEDWTGTLLAGYTGGFLPGDAPDQAMLLRSLFTGEVGSMCEGPQIGQRAPLFELRQAQRDDSVALSSLIGHKPVVLVFGNFSCGPFRSFYPAVDALHKKYGEQVNFLMVYVREAHPTDGWKMESNARVGVAVAQPKTTDERLAVAQQFCSRLEPNLPVVVDEVSDPVGNAYSGMPARLYVIDTAGKVAYKGGRGPFGFKPPELEQAIVMSLFEVERAK